MGNRLNHPVPLAAIQVVGLVCILIAAWNIRDGWYSLGLFGVALLAAVELANKRKD